MKLQIRKRLGVNGQTFVLCDERGVMLPCQLACSFQSDMRRNEGPVFTVSFRVVKNAIEIVDGEPVAE